IRGHRGGRAAARAGEAVFRRGVRPLPDAGGAAPEFLAADSEALAFESAFDAVIFFDSPHHAVDELAALRSAYRALRPGDVCVAPEPGRGHHRRSREVGAERGVTAHLIRPQAGAHGTLAAISWLTFRKRPVRRVSRPPPP